MAKKLVIVESPSKAETIKKYLGTGYNVSASMGHIIDLPKSSLGIDVDADFEPKYITIRGKGDLLTKLKKEAKAADKVFLATDPDREGEAISWHLASALNIDKEQQVRVCFNEITKTAVQKAIKQPRKINEDLVDAQQARRVLDRIVGYKISPILWKKIKKGLSAGRVQSVAARLICDREDEIEAFTPREYWSIGATLVEPKSKKEFKASFYGTKKEKIEPETQAQADDIIKNLDGAQYVVESIKTTLSKRNPQSPFTTSTMQQEASRKINFQSKKTMQIAQNLYEGVTVKGYGKIGLISYMRTDSIRIADEALAAVRDYITSEYGKNYLPDKARVFKSKKTAQDAHEAIRPTNVSITPESVKGQITNDQYKLYKLIWERFVACQMENASIENVACDISAKDYLFKASGSRVVFDGYMKIYIEGSDSKEEKQKMLPKLEEKQSVDLKELEGKQHFTQPPARYTEATLIKALEEDGIGRPSTYMPTITTILARGYVAREKKSFIPTELGRITTELLKKNFENIVDVDFTANMEEQLDEVEDGKIEWKSVIRKFYDPFIREVNKAEEEVGKIEIAPEVSDVACEKCGRMMVYKMGRYGKFLACPGYPECKNAKAIRIETGVKCPKCGGEILQKKSKAGRVYFGCENNTKCDFMTWDMPLKDKKCPKCGGPLFKKNARGGGKTVCVKEGCGYETGGKTNEK